MIKKWELNQDQLTSFDQMTKEAGFDEVRALELIDELCIQKGFTGLRVQRFILTPEGKAMANMLSQIELRKN